MRTSDLLTVVGMTTTAFTAVIARGVLPFERRLSGGWSKFGVEEVIRLALFMDLTAKGMSQGRASALLRQEFNALVVFLNAEPPPPPGPVFFGEATFQKSRASQSKPLEEATAVVCAVAGDIDRAVKNAQRDFQGWQMTGLTIISASNTVDRILRSFIDAGLATEDVQQWAAFMRAPGAKQSWRKGL